MFSRSKAIIGMLALLDAQSGDAPPRQDGQARRAEFSSGTPDRVAPVAPTRQDHQAEASRMSSGHSPPSARNVDDEEEERVEPETGKAFTWPAFKIEFSKVYSEKDVADYWRDACKPVPKKPKAIEQPAIISSGATLSANEQSTSSTHPGSMQNTGALMKWTA